MHMEGDIFQGLLIGIKAQSAYIIKFMCTYNLHRGDVKRNETCKWFCYIGLVTFNYLI